MGRHQRKEYIMDAHFVETFKVVPVAVPKDHSASSLTTEWICMKNAHKATFILYCGAIASGGALTLGVAADAAGSKSTFTAASMDLTLDHYWVSNAATAAASCDVYTKTLVTASTSTFDVTLDNKVYIIEVEASKMGRFTSTSVTYDADYISLAVVAGGSDFMSCVCILTGMRYQEDAPATVLT